MLVLTLWRLKEENKGHILVKAICSKPCLVVIIWCADVPTHLRHWGWVTSTHRGQNKVGSQWPLLLILFRSCSVFMSKTCPQVDIRLLCVHWTVLVASVQPGVDVLQCEVEFFSLAPAMIWFFTLWYRMSTPHCGSQPTVGQMWLEGDTGHCRNFFAAIQIWAVLGFCTIGLFHLCCKKWLDENS